MMGTASITGDTQGRRDAIRALVRAQEVATQEELRELLAKKGFDVTQATLSRDLAKLGARRTSRPSGGTAYELAAASDSAEGQLEPLSQLVVSVDDNGTLVVIKTTPGTASAIALAIDTARMEQVLGTLAGDDTIFLAPARGHAAGKVTQKLKRLFKKG